MLWPPVDLVKKNLLSDTHIEDSDNQKNNPVKPEKIKMPDFLKNQIKRRCATQTFLTTKTLEQGQIRLIKTTKSEQVISFLLAKKATHEHWSGWLVSSEVDYATDQDILLEDETELYFDPVAGMIQTWNPLVVEEKQLDRLVAKLTPKRFKNISQFANQSEKNGSPFDSETGFIGAWRWNNQAEFLSGTPLAADKEDKDPRYQYQKQYQQWAKEIGVMENSGRFKFNQLKFKITQKIESIGLADWFVPQSLTAGLMIGLLGIFGMQSMVDTQEGIYTERGLTTTLPIAYRSFGKPEQELEYIQQTFIEKNEFNNAIAALKYFQTRYPSYGKIPIDKSLSEQQKIELIKVYLQQKKIEEAIFILSSMSKMKE